MRSTTKKPKVLLRENYREMIRTSLNSHIYRRLWAEVDGQVVDLLQGGVLSCAFYVSSILHHFKLIEEVHATVAGLTADMLRSSWIVVDMGFEGSVLEWEPAVQADSRERFHVGFHAGSNEAISHSDRDLSPVFHPLDMVIPRVQNQKPRKIVRTYAHPQLMP